MQITLADTDFWFQLDNTNDIDTPALLVYPERVKSNLAILKSLIDDPARLRPHVKTHKCREVVLITMAAGINKFKCATIAEAEMLGICKAEDVIFAYQPSGPKLKRFLAIIKKYPATSFSCLVDNIHSASEIALLSAQYKLTIAVYLDVNVGMNRTGVAIEEILGLYTFCNRFPQLIIRGFHCYDGHITDKVFNIRLKRCHDWFTEVEKIQLHLVAQGYDKPIIVAGGTPTFTVHALTPEIECSPGTFIYFDQGYQNLVNEDNFIAAALVLCRVISVLEDGHICLDLGHKSIAAENELSKRVFFLNAPELTVVSQSEEHLVMQAKSDHTYKVGDVFYGLPWHICPTVALYERVFTIKNRLMSGEWTTIARDRKITI